MRFRSSSDTTKINAGCLHGSPFPSVRSAARDQRLSGCVTGEMKGGGNQDPNTKRLKRTLIYFDTDTKYAHFRRNPFCQAQNGT